MWEDAVSIKQMNATKMNILLLKFDLQMLSIHD